MPTSNVVIYTSDFHSLVHIHDYGLKLSVIIFDEKINNKILNVTSYRLKQIKLLSYPETRKKST